MSVGHTVDASASAFASETASLPPSVTPPEEEDEEEVDVPPEEEELELPDDDEAVPDDDDVDDAPESTASRISVPLEPPHAAMPVSVTTAPSPKMRVAFMFPRRAS